MRAFVVTECEGMARVDMFVRSDGEVLVNELNTIPGFTETSVYAKLFEASRHRLRARCSSGWSTSRSSATSAAGLSVSEPLTRSPAAYERSWIESATPKPSAVTTPTSLPTSS